MTWIAQRWWVLERSGEETDALQRHWLGQDCLVAVRRLMETHVRPRWHPIPHIGHYFYQGKGSALHRKYSDIWEGYCLSELNDLFNIPRSTRGVWLVWEEQSRMSRQLHPTKHGWRKGFVILPCLTVKDWRKITFPITAKCEMCCWCAMARSGCHLVVRCGNCQHPRTTQ